MVLVLGEGSEIGSAGSGGHASVEAWSSRSHAHSHTSGLEAHGRVETIADAHGTHSTHGGSSWEGRGYSAALHGHRPGPRVQREFVQSCHAVQKTAGQILCLEQ